MGTSWFGYAIVGIAPLAFHVSVQFGRLLVEPVRTTFPVFDRAYNRWPWLLSVLCGVCMMLALAAAPLQSPLALAFWAAAVALFAVDLVACSMAIYQYARKRR